MTIIFNQSGYLAGISFEGTYIAEEKVTASYNPPLSEFNFVNSLDPSLEQKTAIILYRVDAAV